MNGAVQRVLRQMLLIITAGVLPGWMPTSASEAFEAGELQALAEDVGRGLETAWPPGGTSARAHPDDVLRDLRLAAVWPHERFRQPLEAVLRHEDPDLVAVAAEGLLRFGDPELTETVAAMREDGRLTTRGALGPRITYLVRLTQADAGGREPHAELAFNNLKPLARTIPTALAAIEHGTFADRVAAVRWLGGHGLVPKAACLRSIWNGLPTEVERAAFPWWFEHPRVGRERLVEMLEGRLDAPASQMTPVVQRSLLRRLAHLRSERARKPLRQLLDAAMMEMADEEVLSGSDSHELTLLVEAFALVARDEDFEQVSVWGASEAWFKRRAAVAILAASDNPTHVDNVAEFMTSGYDLDLPLRPPSLPDPLRVLSNREWPDPKVKARYLFAMVSLLDRRLDTYGAKDAPHTVEVARTAAVVRALERVANAHNGADYLFSWTGGYCLDKAMATAEKWRAWVDGFSAGLKAGDGQRKN